MSERWIELPVVVEGRWALAQALRQWKAYADEVAALDHKHYLGDGNELEDKFYARAKAALEGLEAAADESAKASLAPKTAFDPAPGWPSLRWSAQEPKRPGWWWFRASPECKAFIVEVRAGEAGLFNAFMPWGRTYLYRTTSSEGEWSGPLPEPECASDAPTTANSVLNEPRA